MGKIGQGMNWLASLVMLVMLLVIAPVFTSTSGYAQADARIFPETGKAVSGRFLQYWNTHGALAQQGYPISGEMQERSDTDGKSYTVQYFERAVFEMHPEKAAPNDVLLSLVGNFLYKQKYPGGAPGQVENTAAGSVLFKETGKRLGGAFRAYWQAHGGLPQQGYPISNEFQEKSDLDGKTYKVQYFERAVFEAHTENRPPFEVLLSQLGAFRYKQLYAAGTPPLPSEVSLTIKDFDFHPPDITVTVGTKITWTNMDGSEHTVADEAHKLFNSGYLHTGDHFSYTTASPGVIHYMCTLHPLMKATITVK